MHNHSQVDTFASQNILFRSSLIESQTYAYLLYQQLQNSSLIANTPTNITYHTIRCSGTSPAGSFPGWVPSSLRALSFSGELKLGVSSSTRGLLTAGLSWSSVLLCTAILSSAIVAMTSCYALENIRRQMGDKENSLPEELEEPCTTFHNALGEVEQCLKLILDSRVEETMESVRNFSVAPARDVSILVRSPGASVFTVTQHLHTEFIVLE